MSTSFLALIVGVVLPGDWGAFGSYLIGGISLAVLAVGSTAPGLLAVAIDRFARVDPAYRNRRRAARGGAFSGGVHAGHPVAGYSLGPGTAHVDFLEAKLERKVYGQIAIKESTMLPLACISMAGVAAEANGVRVRRARTGSGPARSPARAQQVRAQARRSAAAGGHEMGGVSEREHAPKAREQFPRARGRHGEGASVAECLRAIEDAPPVSYE